MVLKKHPNKFKISLLLASKNEKVVKNSTLYFFCLFLNLESLQEKINVLNF